MICSTPHNSVAARRYSRPWFFTSVTISRAIAPVAAEIMPGRPPTKAITTAMQKDAYSPTFGSTPAMMEKAMASGIRANATTRPDSTSPRIFESQLCLIDCNIGKSEARDATAPCKVAFRTRRVRDIGMTDGRTGAVGSLQQRGESAAMGRIEWWGVSLWRRRQPGRAGRNVHTVGTSVGIAKGADHTTARTPDAT